MVDVFKNFTQEDIDAICSRTPHLVKGVNIPELIYDFNRMFHSFGHTDLSAFGGRLNNCYPNTNGLQQIDLSTVYQMYVSFNQKLNHALERIHQKFYGGGRRTNVCFFYTAGMGVSRRHVDTEDVHLFGAHGSTTYRVFDDQDEAHDFDIERGDYLYIPSGTSHWAISHSPRITISFGVG